MASLVGRRGLHARAPLASVWICACALTLVALLGVVSSARAAGDGRAAELVSTDPDNLGIVSSDIAAADDGGAVAFLTSAGTANTRSLLFRSAVLARRGADGWSTLAADPLAVRVPSIFRVNKPIAVSSDFKRVLIWTWAPLDPNDQDPPGVPDLYLVDADSGEATWISHGPTLPDTTNGLDAIFIGGSRDLRTIYMYVYNGGLLPGAPVPSLYEWKDGVLSLASVLPDDTPSANSPVPFAWPFQRSGYKFLGGFNNSPQAHGGAHVVSDDGSTLYFRTPDDQIYVRRNGVTTQLAVSQRTGSVGSPATIARVVAASHDGDTVYFFTDDQLTDAADHGGGLYRYQLSTDDLTLVTPDGAGENDSPLGVTDAIASDDMSAVYFISPAVLAAGATAGQPNIYVYSNGQTKLVTTLQSDGTVERVSRNGRFLVIRTSDSLAGATTNGHVTLYRYDDQTGELGCASCRADGTSQGDASLDDLAPPSTVSVPSPVRNIADDGSVFFASSDHLVAADVTPAWDVYEYTGSAVQLLSSGRSEYDSYVEDNSDDGTDAFFVTSYSLVPADDDRGLADMYDARRGGGFNQPVVAPSARCGDDCQHPAGRPRLQTPASMTATAAPSVVVQPRRSAKVVRRVRFGRVTSSMRRHLQRGQRVAIPLVVTGGGRLTLSAEADGDHGRLRISTAVRRIRAVHRVTAHVGVRLSAPARRALRLRGSLRVVLTARLSGVKAPKHTSFVLHAHGR